MLPIKKIQRRFLRLSCLIFICLAQSSLATAQTGNIKGKIITSDGKPVAGATIALKDKRYTVVSDSNGQFYLNHLDTGKQWLQISFLGLRIEERNIFMLNYQTVDLTITLSESSKKLDEVVVYARRNPNERTFMSAKTGIVNFDLPQTMGIVTNNVISDQQATRVGEIIRNISGVSLTQTRLGVNETYTARGYSIGITGGAGSILKNGLLSNIAGMPEAASLESVEVIKGSTALLYGNVSGGLIVNLVTKKPKFEYGGDIKMQVGSFQQFKPTLDLFGPISKTIAYRFISSYENDHSFRDVVTAKRAYLNPSLLFKLGKKTSLLVLGEALNAWLIPDFGIGTLDSGRILPKGIPISRFINVGWAYNNVKQYAASYHLSHTLNDYWQVTTGGSMQNTDADSYGAGLPNTVSKTGNWKRTLARAHSIEKTFTTQLNLNGKFDILKMQHQLLLGADFTKMITSTEAFKINRNGTPVTTYDVINILDPGMYMPRTDIPEAALTSTTHAPSNRLGIYVQDYIELTRKWSVLAGIRWSYQQNKQTNIYTIATALNTAGTTPTASIPAFSPKFAVVFQPVKTISIFASYSSNFSINTGTDIYLQLLKPSIINQYELGIKNNFFNNRLSANLSIYRIINNHLAQQAALRADGSLNADATIKELKGETTSDGLELDLNASISHHFYFIAGYGYNDMRFTKTSGAKGSNIEGEQVVINPSHTFNFTSFYRFTCKKLNGLKLGLSIFYTGSRFGGYNNTVGQTQAGSRLIPLSGFATVDCSLAYGIKKISIQGKLSNLFNASNYLVHDNYSISPIAPRQFAITLGYRFLEKKQDN